jgi:hypothetical protein
MNIALDSNVLIASLIWGSIGSGFVVYGWKQKAMLPLAGGIALVAISYFIGSALYMSLAAAAIIAAILWLKGRF